MGDFDTRLVSAAVQARDSLRSEILPGLARLAPVLSGNLESLALLQKLTRAVHSITDNLRLAVKDRKYRPDRREMDLPNWTTKSSTK